MNLALATQQQFNSVDCDFWVNEQNDVFMTIDQLAQALEYADRNGIEQIISRNEYLKNVEFSTTHKLSVVEGKRKVKRERRIFTEDGIYEVTMLSKQQRAREFRAFVRKTLKALRKGETVLVKPQTESTKIQIQKQRAEAMLLNARTRQAKLILDMQKNKTLSPVAVELLGINAIEVIANKQSDYRPSIEKTYTATQLAEEFGVTATKIGKIANANGLKTVEFGITVLDNAKHSSKQVPSFRYNESGRKKIKELLQG